MMECIGTGCVADVWLAHFTGDPLMKADKSQVAVKMLRGKSMLHSSQLTLSFLKLYVRDMETSTLNDTIQWERIFRELENLVFDK